MKKIIILIFILLHFTGCGKKATEDVILCGTSIISSMVRDITGEDNIKTLIPHLACPGTYDLKPEDAKKILTSKILIIHPFQKYVADKIIKINKRIKIIYISSSDLNTPNGYITGLNEILNFLINVLPGKKAEYLKNTENKILKIKQRIAEDAMFIKQIKDKKIKVLSSGHQSGFCEYVGLNVVSVFWGPDTLKPKEAANLIQLAKKEKVKFIISNLTGDNDIAADILNKQLNIKKVVLMYFPAQEGMDSWFFNLYNYNLEQIKSEVK